jgi:predicted DNA-binding transcriptional regulator AlpA
MIKIYGQKVNYLTMEETIKKFEISRATIYRWIKIGLPVHKIGYRTLVDPKKVVAFLKKEAK